jgi:hypothetical protein
MCVLRPEQKIGSRQCSHFALSDDDHVLWPEAEKVLEVYEDVSYWITP